jgi:16S rRNA (guanine(966)-N(2))-methyltransferase RsmD
MLGARLDLAGVTVLDLYAGSGALGLEALSRGAARAVFVDLHLACEQTIGENARGLGVSASCRILREDVTVALARLSREGARFSLVLADPPYATAPDTVLASLEEHDLVGGGGVLALEHSARAHPAEIRGAISLLVRRRHGDTALSLYGRAASV